MEKQTKTTRNDLGTLAEDASALMTATAEVAGDKIQEARKHLSSAVDSAKEKAGRARDKAADFAKATDEAVREYPYQAIGIAFGVGALLGFLLLRPGGSHRD